MNRRHILKALFAAPFLIRFYSTPLFASEITPQKTELSLQSFYQISEQILSYEQLNVDISKSLYHIFQQEPWAQTHLQNIASKLSLEKQNNLSLSKLSADETWFLQHFLTTWITGIYYHTSGNKFISYKDALMHSSLQDIRPIPGLSSQDFGFWSMPPTIENAE